MNIENQIEIKDLNKNTSKEMTEQMDTVANLCIQQLEDIAKLYGLKVEVKILLSDVKT